MSIRDPKAIYARLAAEAAEEERLCAEARSQVQRSVSQLTVKHPGLLHALIRRTWQ